MTSLHPATHYVSALRRYDLVGGTPAEEGSVAFDPVLAAAMLLAGQELMQDPSDTCQWRCHDDASSRLHSLISAAWNIARDFPDVERAAAFMVGVINDLIKEKGFDIELDDQGAGQLYMAAMRTIKVQWLKEAERSQMWDAGWTKMTPAFTFQLGDPENGVEVSNTDGPNEWVARIPTKTGKRMYIRKLVEKPGTLDLAALASKMLLGFKPVTRHRMSYVQLPMVDMDVKSDFTPLFSGFAYGPKEIAQCMGQTKFKMNHLGAIVEQVIAAGTLECTVRGIDFDGPCLIAFEEPLYPGVPVAPMWVDPADFKDPGELDFS